MVFAMDPLIPGCRSRPSPSCGAFGRCLWRRATRARRAVRYPRTGRQGDTALCSVEQAMLILSYVDVYFLHAFLTVSHTPSRGKATFNVCRIYCLVLCHACMGLSFDLRLRTRLAEVSWQGISPRVLQLCPAL